MNLKIIIVIVKMKKDNESFNNEYTSGYEYKISKKKINKKKIRIFLKGNNIKKDKFKIPKLMTFS